MKPKDTTLPFPGRRACVAVGALKGKTGPIIEMDIRLNYRGKWVGEVRVELAPKYYFIATGEDDITVIG